MRTRHYYACVWTYGRALDSQGRPIRLVARSLSRAVRDAWVAASETGYVGAPGYREPLLRGDLTRAERYGEVEVLDLDSPDRLRWLRERGHPP